MAEHGRLRLLLLVVLYCRSALGFYLPGVAPHEYQDGDPVSERRIFRRGCASPPSRQQRSQSTGAVSSPLRLVAAQIALKVNKLSSTKTSLPYEYYHLPFCKPEKVRRHSDCLCRLARLAWPSAGTLQGDYSSRQLPPAALRRWKITRRIWAKSYAATVSSPLCMTCR
jgi:hypothetical protein